MQHTVSFETKSPVVIHIPSIHSFLVQIKPTNRPAPDVNSFIAHSVEHRTGIAKVMGSIPVVIIIIIILFRAIAYKLLHNCDDHSFINPQFNV